LNQLFELLLLFFKVSDEEFKSYWDEYSAMRNRFEMFIQIKLIISPIIEYIILLDRLIYLFEKTSAKSDDCDGYEHHLVKLFDATKSPRCYALVSYPTQGKDI
jgi:hypothetical protein